VIERVQEVLKRFEKVSKNYPKVFKTLNSSPKPHNSLYKNPSLRNATRVFEYTMKVFKTSEKLKNSSKT
jgi:hypothetical protein